MKSQHPKAWLHIYALICSVVISSVQAVTVFSTTFDYITDPLLGSGDAASDLNGATGQIGTWGGSDPLPNASGGDLSGNHAIGISTDRLLVDRPEEDITLTTTFTDAIALDGAGSYSFDFLWRRVISSAFSKDVDLVGYDDSGTELLHIRLGARFDNATGQENRIGVVDGGGSVNWDLPGSGDQDGYLDTPTGGSMENIRIDLGVTGFTITYDGDEVGDDFTSGLISYTGAGGNLAYVSFEDIDGSTTTNDDRAGFFLDNVIAQGTVIPEPSALLLGAMGSLLLLRRRR